MYTLAYFFAIASRKPVVSNAVTGLGILLHQGIGFILGIYLFIIAISLLFSGKFILFLLYVFIGYSLIYWLLGILQLPFLFITGFYMEKLEKVSFLEETATAEILDTTGQVVGISEGDTVISTRMARFFTALFLLNLLSLLVTPEKNFYISTWIDYVTVPFFWIISECLLFGIPYLFYHRIKHKQWFSKDKRVFFTSVLRLSTYGYAVICVLLYVIIPLI